MTIYDLEPLPVDELVPPENILPAHSQLNDVYLHALEYKRRQINAAEHGMTAKHCACVRHHLHGRSPKEIAGLVGYTTITVSRFLKTAPAQRLITLSRQLQRDLEGPTMAQRINMVSRVACANEVIKPDTCLKAVDLLNKMSGDLPDSGAGQGGTNGQVNVTVNVHPDLVGRVLDRE